MDCDFTFCFEVDDDYDEHDGLMLSNKPPFERWIKNKDNDVLILRDGDQLCYERLRKSQLSSSDCVFRIHTYNRTKPEKNEWGRIIILYTTKDNKYKVVCCDHHGEVNVETRDSLPKEIGDNGDTFLFFLRTVKGTLCHNFVPFRCRSHVLGFDRGAKDSRLKLVALPQAGEPDDRTHKCLTNIELIA